MSCLGQNLLALALTQRYLGNGNVQWDMRNFKIDR
jgi:hypothetical protein